jgi:hypothetical protein
MFDSAKRKLDRAKKHIADLESLVQSFSQSKPYTLVVQEHPHTRTQTRAMMGSMIFTSEVPDGVALILGDAVHNLRTSLDHIAWELVGLDRGTQDKHTAFTLRDTRVNYDSACNGILTPRADTKKFFLALECYEGGKGQDLYRLGQLDNTDKHTTIALALRAGRLPGLQLIDPEGKVVDTMSGTNFAGLGVGFGWPARPGYTVQFDPNSEPAVDVTFRDIFQGESVAPTLLHLADAVQQTLGKFEVFVSTRK